MPKPHIVRNVINIVLVLGIIAPAFAIGAMIIQDRRKEAQKRAEADAAKAAGIVDARPAKVNGAPGAPPMQVRVRKMKPDEIAKKADAARAKEEIPAGAFRKSAISSDVKVAPLDLDTASDPADPGALRPQSAAIKPGAAEPTLDQVLDRLFARRPANPVRTIDLP